MNGRIEEIKNITESLPGRLIIAIDGRCAAGKTTLAKKLQKELNCNVIHTDDFFLPAAMRTNERLSKSGENIHHERLLHEVLLPLKAGKPFSYKPFCCKTQSLLSPVTVLPNRLTVVEGTYSCHEKLFDFYDLHIFLSLPPEKQLNRLLKREGEEKLRQFQSLWIPLEEAYFLNCGVKEKCEIIIEDD